jgi:hypothetical protein
LVVALVTDRAGVFGLARLRNRLGDLILGGLVIIREFDPCDEVSDDGQDGARLERTNLGTQRPGRSCGWRDVASSNGGQDGHVSALDEAKNRKEIPIDN